MLNTRTVTVIAVLMTWPGLSSAQTAEKPAPAVASPAAKVPAAAPEAPAAEPYSYDPGGRRDPFVSLVSRGTQPDSTGRHSEGLGGLLTSEMTVTGIVQTRGAYVALVKAPDGKTFSAHVNDRIADGTIRTINLQGMVIMQDVNDPLSLVKVREVRKGLRTSDDIKQ